jgi:CcmD family protein
MDFLGNHTLYIVLLISLIVWIVFFVYMFMIDKKISKLEKLHTYDLTKKDS